MYLLLLLLWIIFNGKITWEIVLIGAVVVGILYAFACRFMGFHIKREIFVYRHPIKILHYLIVLLWEILKANFVTLKTVLSVHKKPEPALISFQVDLKTDIGRTLLANSITLTPGTITVALQDNRYTVHCLDRSMGEGIEDSVFVRLIRSLEDDYIREAGHAHLGGRREKKQVLTVDETPGKDGEQNGN